jgi:hypothetical protein
MNENDPLRLALVAIQEFEKGMDAYEAAGLGVDGMLQFKQRSTEMQYQRAQLRTLWALAGEVRLLRYVMEGDDETGDA